MHGCVMENIQKIKIKLENIWIDLMRSIYALYKTMVTCMRVTTTILIVHTKIHTFNKVYKNYI